MKKILCSIALVTLALSAAFASAEQGLTATSMPVIMKAIVPEYIGLAAVKTDAIVFDFSLIKDKETQRQLASGYSGMMAIAPTAPSWNLTYNLRQRTVTVCAYASDLMGAEFHPLTLNKIPATYINGTSLVASANNATTGYVYFDKNAGSNCSTGFGASVMLDKITNATSSFAAGYNQGVGKPEGFGMLQINGHEGAGAPPAPGVYLGFMTIVAQAI